MRDTKPFYIAAAFALAFVAVILLSIAPDLSEQSAYTGSPSQSQTMTVKAISYVNFDSNDKGLAGPAWLVVFNEGGAGGDLLIGQVGKADFAASTGATRTVDFEIDAKREYSRCIWTATPTQTDIYKIESLWKNSENPLDSSAQRHYVLGSDAEYNCKKEGGFAYVEQAEFWDWGYCYAYKKTGDVNTFDQANTKLDWSVKVTAIVSGTESSAWLSPTTQVSKFGNGLGVAKWSGNMIANELCPSGISSIVLAHNIETNKDVLADKSYIDKLGTPYHMNDAVSSCLTQAGYSIAGIVWLGTNVQQAQNCINIQNGQIDNIFQSDKATINSASAFKAATFTTNTMTLDNNMIIPEIAAKLAGTWVGVRQQVCKPAWLSVTTPVKFASDSGAYVSGVLRNDGEVACLVNYHAECSGITVLDSQNSVTLNPGQTATASIAVKGSNGGKTDSACACNLVAQSANSVDLVRSSQITCSISPKFSLECKAPFIADYANNRCSCPIAASVPPAGKIFDPSTCTFVDVPATCGNGVCDASETKGSCPADCGVAACYDDTALNQCSSVNKGMYCNSEGNLVKQASCSIVCDADQKYDSKSGTCVKKDPGFDFLQLWPLAVVIVIVGGFFALKKKKRK